MAVSEQAPVRFQRGNFVVADLDRPLTFYEGVLGFEVEYRLGDNLDSYSRSVFDVPDAAQLGFVTLNLPDQRRVMALTEVKGMTLEPAPHPRRSAIVLETHDPDAVKDGALNLGLTVYDEEVLKTPDGRVGREIVIYIFPST